MSNKSIYELELHEWTEIRTGPIACVVVRVPNGWNYYVIRMDHNSMVCQFVPYSSEFKGQSINTKIHAQAGTIYKLLREYVEMFENNADADTYDHLYHKIIETLQKIES